MHKKYLAWLSSLLLLTTIGVCQKILPIIPMPVQVALGEGFFTLNPQTAIVVDHAESLQEAEIFIQTLQQVAGFKLQVSVGKTTTHPFILLRQAKAATYQKDGYHMQVSAGQIVIEAGSGSGFLYGLNNLIFMLERTKGEKTYAISACTIQDTPRFAYRGMMLDVSRHFRSVEYIKQHLDRMALLKLNVFHWHLTDDQGWRIEIKKYPKLTETGGWRHGTIIGRYPGTGNDNQRHGGFYTQEQVKEIVAYAASRHITVVPEIEMPGHASAAIASYPWLSCFPDEETLIPKHPSEASIKNKGKKVQETFGVFNDVFAPTEETFTFLQGVIDEVAPLFPGKYIHIGGDECPKENWKRSTFCQNLIKEKGLKDEHGLQSYFIQRMEKYINSKGKQIIGWDEILEGGLAPNATVMSWRGEAGGIEAAKQNHTVIMSPTNYCYFDYSQTKNEDSIVIGGFLPLEKVYQYNPVPEALAGTPYEKMVLGAQANLWTEYIRTDSKLEYMVFPRLAAMAENVWTPQANKNWDVFREKLPAFFMLLDKLGTGYSKAYYSIQTNINPNKGFEGVEWVLNSQLPGSSIAYTLPESHKVLPYEKPVLVTQSGTYKASLLKDGKEVETLVQSFQLHKATGRKVTLQNMPSAKYRGNGGIQGLVNGVTSKSGLQSPEWLGWEGGDMEAVIDLGHIQPIREVVVNVLEASGSWIYRPKAIIVYVSDNQQTYTLAGSWGGEPIRWNKEIRACKIPLEFVGPQTKVTGRYIQIWAQNIGEIPTGQPGAGNKAWLFADEIEVY